MKITYTYPGDPSTVAELTFGGDFLDANPDRVIRITDLDLGGETVIPLGDDISCDLCNAPVRPIDPVVLSNNRLYCWECAERWIFPYKE